MRNDERRDARWKDIEKTLWRVIEGALQFEIKMEQTIDRETWEAYPEAMTGRQAGVPGVLQRDGVDVDTAVEDRLNEVVNEKTGATFKQELKNLLNNQKKLSKALFEYKKLWLERPGEKDSEWQVREKELYKNIEEAQREIADDVARRTRVIDSDWYNWDKFNELTAKARKMLLHKRKNSRRDTRWQEAQDRLWKVIDGALQLEIQMEIQSEVKSWQDFRSQMKSEIKAQGKSGLGEFNFRRGGEASGGYKDGVGELQYRREGEGMFSRDTGSWDQVGGLPTGGEFKYRRQGQVKGEYKDGQGELKYRRGGEAKWRKETRRDPGEWDS